MDKMVVRVPVTIKSKVTEKLKAKIVADLKSNVQAAGLDLEQFEFDARRAINEQANVNSDAVARLKEQIDFERSKRQSAKKEVEDKLERAENLEIGSEIGHGQIERSVEITIGSNLEELMGAEIVVEDGKVIAFRA
ncbi:MAG: YlqD family protein [Acidaminococcaceae bacterium]|nr:YlqD family protein [Acidaminococcaceae bacterium]